MIRLRHRLATGLSLGFLLSSSVFALAQEAPAADQPPKAQQPAQPDKTKAAADKGAADKAAAEKAATAQKAAAEKAAADKAAADKAAAEKAAAAQKAAAERAAADKAAADKAAAEKAAAAQKAAAERATADKAAADKALADKAATERAAAAQKAAAEKAAADKAAADKAAADKAAAEKAATAQKAAAEKAAADKAAADKAAADKAAADKAAAENAAGEKAAAEKKAAADKAAAEKAATAQKAAAEKAAADKAAADKAAAGEKAAAEKAAADRAAAEKAAAAQKAAADKAAVENAAADKAAAEKAAGEKAAAEKAAAEKAAAGKAANPPAEATPAKSAAGKSKEERAPATTPLPDITAGLKDAATAYNRGVAALSKSGADKAAVDSAKEEVKAAEAKIDALCKSNRFDSVGQCLAQYAVQLSSLPAAAGGKPTPEAPIQQVEVINNLPKGVSQQAVAPLLDSAKDQKAGKGPTAPATEPARPAPKAAPDAPASNGPPPKSDKAAQADLALAKVAPIDHEKGQRIEASAVPPAQVPQNVTIVNQTVINNMTNVTTNIQNNNGPGAQQNGAQGVEPTAAGQRAAERPLSLGTQLILQIGSELIINSRGEDQQRISDRDRDHTSYERVSGDRYREIVERPDGVRVVTIYNRNGDIVRRSRFDRDGREYVLAYFDDSHDEDLLQWRDPGEDLPPLRLHIPAREYVLDADGADEGLVRNFFAQPPVERVQRLYSIDEVKRSSRIRDMVRRLEISDLTFDTGEATLSEDQAPSLSKVAGAMLELLKANPAETFLIEGHTDAVGSDIANLKLSDARAATVAEILTDAYHIPPENLATQGYGKRYLKVQTDLPEPVNRRVTIRRITSLVTVVRN